MVPSPGTDAFSLRCPGSATPSCYLTEVDHHDHEALIALDAASMGMVGIGRYVRGRSPDIAEIGVTVVDDWHGRGLGTLLLELLAARARAEDISRFSAVMLASNDDILDLMRRLGPTKVVDREGPTVEVEAELPSAGLSSELRTLLREVADEGSPVEPRGTLAGQR